MRGGEWGEGGVLGLEKGTKVLSLTTMRLWLPRDDMATTRGVELQSNDQTLLQGGCQRLKSF